jgi:hypothetical protein
MRTKQGYFSLNFGYNTYFFLEGSCEAVGACLAREEMLAIVGLGVLELDEYGACVSSVDDSVRNESDLTWWIKTGRSE